MEDFDSWRQELLEAAVIAQDGDGTDPVIAERRFQRLIEMLQALTGREQDGVFHAVS